MAVSLETCIWWCLFLREKGITGDF